MPNIKSYKIGEDVYDVPDTDTKAFLKENPKATEVKSFIQDKDTFDVPLQDVDAFLREVPNAKPLNVEAKKKSGNPKWDRFVSWVRDCPIKLQWPIRYE